MGAKAIIGILSLRGNIDLGQCMLTTQALIAFHEAELFLVGPLALTLASSALSNIQLSPYSFLEQIMDLKDRRLRD